MQFRLDFRTSSVLGCMVDNLLSATGCETTKALYSKNKHIPLRKRQEQPALCNLMQVFLLFVWKLEHSHSCIDSRGRGGIATYRGMSAHPIIGGSPLYLSLKLCHKVAHNPNIDLLILTFACTYINKKLCLKMYFLRKLLLCASRTYILASSTINCAENVVMHFQTRV